MIIGESRTHGNSVARNHSQPAQPILFSQKKTAGSMYCTFTYIYIGDFHSKLLGKYTNPMDPSWERNQQPKLPIGDTWRVSGQVVISCLAWWKDYGSRLKRRPTGWSRCGWRDISLWSNYSDLTRPHPKIIAKSRLVKIIIWPDSCFWLRKINSQVFFSWWG